MRQDAAASGLRHAEPDHLVGIGRQLRGEAAVCGFGARTFVWRDGERLFLRVDGLDVGARHRLMVDDSGAGEAQEARLELERLGPMAVDGEEGERAALLVMEAAISR